MSLAPSCLAPDVFAPEIIKAARAAVQNRQPPPTERVLQNADRCLEAVRALCPDDRIRVTLDADGGLAVYMLRPHGYVLCLSAEGGDVVVSGKVGREIDTWEVDRPVDVAGISRQIRLALDHVGTR